MTVFYSEDFNKTCSKTDRKLYATVKINITAMHSYLICYSVQSVGDCFLQ